LRNLLCIFLVLLNSIASANSLIALGDIESVANNHIIILKDDYGGYSSLYEYRAEAMRGRTLKLSGICASACTIYLWKQYRIHVCASETAQLWFHKPLWLDMYEKPIVNAANAVEADRLWNAQDMVFLPDNIVAKLKAMYVPNTSAGDNWGDAVKLHARDYLPAC
jgi:hypothetical protein